MKLYTFFRSSASYRVRIALTLKRLDYEHAGRSLSRAAALQRAAFGCDLSAFPAMIRVDAECRALAAFAKAAPENQPDAE